MKRFLVFLFSLTLPVFVYAQNVSVYPNLGHGGDLGAFAYNPDRNILASVSFREKFIKIWDAENAREIKTLGVDVSSLYSLIWNKDYTVLVCGAWGGDILFIDFQSGAELRRWKAHRGSVNSLCLSPDGKEILSASFDGTVKKWDSVTGREIAVFANFGGSINQAVFSADGKYFVAACSNGSIKKCDAVNGRELLSIPAHTGPVHSIACSSDANLIVSGGFDGLVKMWRNGALTRSVNAHNGPVTDLAFSPDYTRIASCSTDGIVKEWSIINGNKLNEFTGHERNITALQYKNNSRILSSSLDNSIKEWDIFSAEPVNVYTGYSSYIHALVFSSDDKYIYSGHGNYITYKDSVVKIWDAKTGVLVNNLEGHKKPVSSVDLNAEIMKIASGSSDCTVRIWDMNNNTCDYVLEGHTMDVTAVSFSPDGARLASASLDNTVKIWDVKTGKKIKEYIIEHERIENVKWRPDGKQIAAAASDKVYLWEIDKPSGELIIEDTYNYINRIAYSPDSLRLALGNFNNTISVWDTGNGEKIFSIDKDIFPKTPVCAVQFSSDGKYIVSASGDSFSDHKDNSIKIWDAESGNLLTSMKGHDDNVNALAFSKDGRRVVSSSIDSTIRIWELVKDEKTGELKGVESVKMIGFTNGEWIVITPEGYYNASPRGDQYLNVRIDNNVYGIDQYRHIFYRPDIVTVALWGNAAYQKLVKEAGDNIMNVMPAPKISIEPMRDSQTIKTPQISLTVTINDNNLEIKNVWVTVNGRLTAGKSVSRDIAVPASGLDVTGKDKYMFFTIPIDVEDGTNIVEVFASNGYAEGRDAISFAAEVHQIPPDLWLLAIGVNRYASPLVSNLSYAVNDARELAGVFKGQEGKRYGKVNTLILADDAEQKPTAALILKSFEWFNQAKDRDLCILFIAGHAVNGADGNYYFLPSDSAFDASGNLNPDTAISHSDINSVLKMPGRKLFILDTCHSAGAGKTGLADTNSFIRQAMEYYPVIFSSSRGSEFSQERPEYRHGLFTYGIIKGIGGEAVSRSSGTVTMKSLDSYVSEIVSELSNGRQNPTTITPNGYVNFILAGSEKK